MSEEGNHELHDVDLVIEADGYGYEQVLILGSGIEYHEEASQVYKQV